MPQHFGPIVGPGTRIQFTYKNWKDETHEYVIDVEYFEWKGMDAHEPNSKAPETMVLHGFTVTRDGDPRTDMGPGPGWRRRSFRVDGLIDVVRVDR